ncbi:LCP family protein [Streptomyces sp. NPDC059740]|uniref:LCP family protein n=1 Tax=Streptomyces sp. NPDC059740 TaxID=3346926 RepID=UPI00365EC038
MRDRKRNTPGDGGRDGHRDGGRGSGAPASPRRGDRGRDGQGDTMALRVASVDGSDGPSGDRPRSPRRRGRRILRGVAISVVLLVVVTAGGAYAYYEHLNGNIEKGERSSGDSKVAKPKADAYGHVPLNILLLGSDSRNSDENVKLGGHKDGRGQPPLADVQMLLHISADRKHASLTSIPRDTRVDIPQCTDPKTHKVYPPTNDIINSSLARGGPGCTLATWQNLTHVYIDHWMMVDFAGVVDMTTEIGGVDVCVEKPVWDRPTARVHGGSGLKLTTAGHHTITGKQALQWLRTRDAFGSDLGRAKAQHMYLNSMMRKMKEQNLFGSPVRLMGLAETATKALTVSSEIGTPKDLYDLAMQFKDIPTDQIVTVTMPRIEDPQNVNHVLPKPGEADHLWSMLQHDVAFDSHGKDKSAAKPSSSPSGATAHPAGDIPLTVVNGTAGSNGGAPVPGRAGGVVTALTGKGFSQAKADPVQQPTATTRLNYPEADGAQGRADALKVASALHIPSSAVKADADADGITLLVGADWKQGTDYSASLPKDGSLPDDVDAQKGSDDDCMPIYPPYDNLTP